MYRVVFHNLQAKSCQIPAMVCPGRSLDLLVRYVRVVRLFLDTTARSHCDEMFVLHVLENSARQVYLTVGESCAEA